MDILMLLRQKVSPTSGGRGGTGGNGGIGGSGGAGGRGGSSYSWSETRSYTSNGQQVLFFIITRSYLSNVLFKYSQTTYYSNPGGSSGPSGYSGSNGASGNNGYNGSTGTYSILV